MVILFKHRPKNESFYNKLKLFLFIEAIAKCKTLIVTISQSELLISLFYELEDIWIIVVSLIKVEIEGRGSVTFWGFTDISGVVPADIFDYSIGYSQQMSSHFRLKSFGILHLLGSTAAYNPLPQRYNICKGHRGRDKDSLTLSGLFGKMASTSKHHLVSKLIPLQSLACLEGGVVHLS